VVVIYGKDDWPAATLRVIRSAENRAGQFSDGLVNV
jgi:hypothetical protein